MCPDIIPYARFPCVKELSHQNVKARAKTSYRFALLYFTYGHVNLLTHKSARNLAVCTGDYQVACTPEDSKPPRTWPLACAFRSRCAVFLHNFIFSFNDQRGAVELTTDAWRSDNLKRTHQPRAAPRRSYFRTGMVRRRCRFVLSFKPAFVFCFPVSLYVVLASCNSQDYLVGRETGLVVGLPPPETHMMDLIVETYAWG